MMMERLNVFWLTGASCDGCSVSVLGDASVVPIEDLLLGRVPGLPRIVLFHPLLSADEGEAFVEHFRRAAAGEMDPYVLVIETSVPKRLVSGSYAWLGEEESLVDIAEWVRRLAGRAQAVIALGDCAVYGGPHTGDDVRNASGARGVESLLGSAYRSRAALPVVHLPGCSVPPVFIATVAAIVHWMQGDGPPLELDELGRPVFAYAGFD